MRDSADPRHLFSLSVQRSEEGGPTSVRIHFERGLFRLDAEESIQWAMPAFPSVVELIEHYLPPPVGGGGDGGDDGDVTSKEKEDPKRVWVDNIGKVSSPIRLRRPLYNKVPSLSHFARLSVNRRLAEVGGKVDPADATRLDLPRDLAAFVAGYPHRV